MNSANCNFLYILSISDMPRTSKRKTQHANYTADATQATVIRIRQHGQKI